MKPPLDCLHQYDRGDICGYDRCRWCGTRERVGFVLELAIIVAAIVVWLLRGAQ